jgi:hypothetical protein
MMKKMAIIMILLALCIPALAVDVPDMVGKWTGAVNGVAWSKNTDYQTTGKVEFWESAYTIIIDEQNGTRFSGKVISDSNPLHTEVLLGIISSDNESLTLLDENDYYWGLLKSPTEMELFRQGVDIHEMDLATGNFTKE